MAACLSHQAVCHLAVGNPTAALKNREHVHGVLCKRRGKKHPSVVLAAIEWASALIQTRSVDEGACRATIALSLCGSLGEEHPHTIFVKQVHAVGHQRLNNHDDSAEYSRQVLKIQKQVLGVNHAEYIKSLMTQSVNAKRNRCRECSVGTFAANADHQSRDHDPGRRLVPCKRCKFSACIACLPSFTSQPSKTRKQQTSIVHCTVCQKLFCSSCMFPSLDQLPSSNWNAWTCNCCDKTWCGDCNGDGEGPSHVVSLGHFLWLPPIGGFLSQLQQLLHVGVRALSRFWQGRD